jgi:uncharacterized protein
MAIGILSIHISIPGCRSLKEKRSHLQPILKRLHREYNVSVAEVDLQDIWQETIISLAMVNNNHGVIQRTFNNILEFITQSWPNVYIEDQHLELI